MAAPSKPLPTFEPILMGYKRLSGGSIEATWSVAPGRRVHRVIPVEAFDPATISHLTEEIKSENP